MTLFDYTINRLDYGELLRPKVGHKVRFAIGMTYSLDLEALIGVPVALGMFNALDSAQMKNPFFILEAINRASDNIAIFSQAGAIKLPVNIKPVYALLENSVFSVNLGNKRIFHPKLWLVEYYDESNQSYLKLITLSRNLTFDRSFDMAVALEGKVGNEDIPMNKPLVDLVEYLVAYAPPSKRKQIRNMISKLKTTKFEPSAPFDTVNFHTFGFKDYNIDTASLFKNSHSLLVVSPFLSESVIKDITKKATNTTLITRKSSLTPKIIQSFNDIYITKELVMEDSLLDVDEGTQVTPRDVHAKMYFKQHHKGKSMFIGSLNATSSAFNRNIEWMIELGFMKGRYSYNRILSELIPEKNSPFEKLNIETIDSTTEILGENYEMHEIVRGIDRGFVTQNTDDRYSLHVIASAIPHEVEIAPLYRMNNFKKLQKEVVFENLLLSELSSFFVIRYREYSKVLKLTIDSLPRKDRDDAIYRTIISDSRKFLAYLAFVLADDFASIGLEQKTYLDAFNKGSSQNVVLPTPLYERMLRTVAQDPERIIAVEKVMERLDASVVTPKIRQFVEAFKSAVMRRKRK